MPAQLRHLLHESDVLSKQLLPEGLADVLRIGTKYPRLGESRMPIQHELSRDATGDPDQLGHGGVAVSFAILFQGRSQDVLGEASCQCSFRVVTIR